MEKGLLTAAKEWWGFKKRDGRVCIRIVHQTESPQVQGPMQAINFGF
jgi:hypothetical protein